MKKEPSQKRKTATAIPRSPVNCLRMGTLYAKIFDALYLHREKGVGRPDLISEVQRATGRPKRLVGYGVSVVTSPTEDGSYHRSAKKIADIAWFEKENGWVRMRIRNDKPQEN